MSRLLSLQTNIIFLDIIAEIIISLCSDASVPPGHRQPRKPLTAEELKKQRREEYLSSFVPLDALSSATSRRDVQGEVLDGELCPM